VVTGYCCTHFKDQAIISFGTSTKKQRRNTEDDDEDTATCALCDQLCPLCPVLRKGKTVNPCDRIFTDEFVEEHGLLGVEGVPAHESNRSKPRGCDACRRKIGRVSQRAKACSESYFDFLDACETTAGGTVAPRKDLPAGPMRAWAAFVGPQGDVAGAARVEQFNVDCCEKLFDYTVPEMLRPPYKLFLEQLGVDEDVQTVCEDTARIARFMLAVQGNHFFGTAVGRGVRAKAGEKIPIVRGLQTGSSWLMMYGSTDAILRAFNKIGVTLAPRTASREQRTAANNWLEYLDIDQGCDAVFWLDNINAVVFPDRFLPRHRDDKQASEFDSLPSMAEEDLAKISCSCTLKGVCGPGCKCTRNIVLCSPTTCACPCTLLQRPMAGHRGLLGAWVHNKEMAIAAVPAGPTQARINPVHEKGSSDTRSACKNMNAITSVVGNLKRSVAAPPLTKGEVRAAYRDLSDIPAAALLASGCSVANVRAEGRARTMQGLQDMIDLYKDFSKNQDQWREMHRVTARVQAETEWETTFLAAHTKALAFFGGPAASSTVNDAAAHLARVTQLTVGNFCADGQVAARQSLFLGLARDHVSSLQRPAITRIAIMKEWEAQHDLAEREKRARVDTLAGQAVRDMWAAALPNKPEPFSMDDGRDLRAWRDFSKLLTGTRCESRALRTIKEAIAAARDPALAELLALEQVRGTVDDDAAKDAGAGAGCGLDMKMMKMVDESPGNYRAVERQIEQCRRVTGVTTDPVPAGQGVVFPFRTGPVAAGAEDVVYSTPKPARADADATCPKPKLTAIFEDDVAPAAHPPALPDDAEPVPAGTEIAKFLIGILDWGVKQVPPSTPPSPLPVRCHTRP
jgi:hypothetical protein